MNTNQRKTIMTSAWIEVQFDAEAAFAALVAAALKTRALERCKNEVRVNNKEDLELLQAAVEIYPNASVAILQRYHNVATKCEVVCITHPKFYNGRIRFLAYKDGNHFTFYGNYHFENINGPVLPDPELMTVVSMNAEGNVCFHPAKGKVETA